MLVRSFGREERGSGLRIGEVYGFECCLDDLSIVTDAREKKAKEGRAAACPKVVRVEKGV
jgi:hypothetical protein